MGGQLLLVLWPSSVMFAAVLSFRVGGWWNHTHTAGHREFVQGRHEDEAFLDEDEWTERPQPAADDPEPWCSEDANTEVLPRMQDIRPPIQETPIRRPPWVG